MGCRAPCPGPIGIGEEQRKRLQAEAQRSFDFAVLEKPRLGSDGMVDEEVARLAPLIVSEVPTLSAGWSRDSSARSGGWGRVCSEAGRTNIAGHWFKTVSFAAMAERPDGTEEEVWRLRMSLNAEGFPIIFEVARPGDKVDPIFVSESLELAARDAYGPPLPGRTYSVEQSVESAPNTVVIKVLENGPMPMGPYVYLRGEAKDIVTLLCRCSPSQVNEFVQSAYYELVVCDPAIETEALPPEAPLDVRLRFPSGFGQHESTTREP